MKKVRIGTVFSGIGAPEFAAQRVFKKVKGVFACEIDKFARQSFEANHRVKFFYSDITTVDFKKHKGQVDILIGGSPCQAFSIAGKRKGFEDTRGTLFFDFARSIKETKPKVFIFENVKGMVNHDKGQTLDIVLKTLGGLGYEINARVLNTKEHGVPQNRERIFIVGVRRKNSVREDLPLQTGKLLKNKLHNKLVELNNAKNLTIWQEFIFPEPITLEKRLKDILESEVDEKYYLSEKALNGFKTHDQRMQEWGNGGGENW